MTQYFLITVLESAQVNGHVFLKTETRRNYALFDVQFACSEDQKILRRDWTKLKRAIAHSSVLLVLFSSALYEVERSTLTLTLL